jgi:hypothetical protein
MSTNGHRLIITEFQKIDKTCLSRILRLAAPDVPDAILAGERTSP